MLKTEVAATDCGAPATPTMRAVANRNTFIFIVPLCLRLNQGPRG